MALLTTNYEANEKAGTLAAYNVKGNTRIWRGALTAVDDTSGLLVPAHDSAGMTFCGVAFEPGDNGNNGLDGAVGVRVQKEGAFVYGFSGSRTQAVVGKKAYAVDDNTVGLVATTTNDLYVGDITGLVGATQVRVRINRAAA